MAEYISQPNLLKRLLPVSRTTLWRLRSRAVDPFPAPVIVGTKRLWSVAVVRNWIDRQSQGGTHASAT